MVRRISIIMVIVLLISSSAVADEQEQKNYLIAKVVTPLQRYLLMAKGANALAVVNVETSDDGKVNETRLNVAGLRAELKALAKEVSAPEPELKIVFRYAGNIPQPADRKAYEAKVSEVCRQAGFARLRTSGTFTSGSWEDELTKYERVPGESNAAEDPIDHELVRVYPVKTKLTRYQIGDADCLVFVRQPFDGRFKRIPKSTREAIATCLKEFKMREEPKLVLSGYYTTSGEAKFFQFFQRMNKEPSKADRFAQELGFASCSWAMAIPMGLSPETLLGKRAPAFTLESLAGGKIDLHEAIKDRVAIIAFWGVACGGCRVEAPHLTELHKKYQDQGLRVIAVNGYDETKQVVSDYARETKLTHPIALMGGEVAREKYTVASYPVTFFVDHDGTVVDYHLGFEDGDESMLASHVERLLRDRLEASSHRP